MTTEDIVTDLDAALTGERAKSYAEQIAEEYPDAPPQSIETAQQIEETRSRIERLSEILDRKEQAKQARQAAIEQYFRDAVAELELRTAALAADSGTATEEEKQLLKEATADDQADDLDGLAKRLSTSNTADTHSDQ